jgi:predicted glutamine amidotransferase
MMLGDGLGDQPKAACDRLIAVVAKLQAEAGITEAFRFTAAWSDGAAIYAARYASDLQPPSLYTKRLAGNSGTLVVSEPLDGVRDGWQAVPAQSFVTVTRDGVTIDELGSLKRAAAA